MENLKELVTALNDLIKSGDTLNAIEKFYATDVQMQKMKTCLEKDRKLALKWKELI